MTWIQGLIIMALIYILLCYDAKPACLLIRDG